MFTVITSNETLNLTIFNLTSFGRYIATVIACQNFTQELVEYAHKFNKVTNETNKSKNLFVEYLKYFSVEKFCSKTNLITFRSQADSLFTNFLINTFFLFLFILF